MSTKIISRTWKLVAFISLKGTHPTTHTNLRAFTLLTHNLIHPGGKLSSLWKMLIILYATFTVFSLLADVIALKNRICM